MSARLTPPTDVTLADQTSDRVRRSHAQAIRELQTEVLAASGVGRLIAVQTLADSGTYVPTKGTMMVRVRLCGTGGAGGGASAAGVTLSCGAGGGSGVTIDFIVRSVTPITGGPVTIGALPAAGSSAGGTGGTGGDSIALINGVTYTAKGGTGGVGSTASSTVAIATRGTPGIGSTLVGTQTGHPGGDGVVMSTTDIGDGWPGDGGASALGLGGLRAAANNQPAAPAGFGGGGAGAAAVNGSAAGGLPARGALIVEEFS
jgi:hypothetical protein